MLRPRTLLACAASLCMTGWPLGAAAQDVEPQPPPAAPPTEPPPATPPAEPPPATPPAEPAPPSPPQPPEPPGEAPPAAPSPAPPPAPPPGTAPPSAAFPIPPSPPAPDAKKPNRRPPPTTNPVAPPTAQSPTAAPTTPAATSTLPRRATEGLFEEKKPASGAAAPDEGDKSEKDDDVDQFKIGPVAGIGLPSVISFGGTVKLTRFLGGGVNIGLIPKVQLSYYGQATLSYQHYDIYGRIYPFGGGFFLSGGAGYATVDGTLDSTKSLAFSTAGVSANGTVNYQSKGTVRTLMLTALIGYFYTTSIGFSFGVDAGAQIPIAPSQINYESQYSFTTSITGPAAALVQSQAKTLADPYVQETDKSVRDTLEKIGRSTIPTLNLRIGRIL